VGEGVSKQLRALAAQECGSSSSGVVGDLAQLVLLGVASSQYRQQYCQQNAGLTVLEVVDKCSTHGLAADVCRQGLVHLRQVAMLALRALPLAALGKVVS
jgi:hypothetical protein